MQHKSVPTGSSTTKMNKINNDCGDDDDDDDDYVDKHPGGAKSVSGALNQLPHVRKVKYQSGHKTSGNALTASAAGAGSNARRCATTLHTRYSSLPICPLHALGEDVGDGKGAHR